MESPNYVSVSQYAAMCGDMTAAAIYARISTGTLPAMQVKFRGGLVTVIDVTLYPPEKLKSGRKKFKI